MTDAVKDPQQLLDDLIAAQVELASQIEVQRKVSREAALATIKKLVLAHNFKIVDMKEFLKAATPRKSATRKSTPRKK